MTVFFSKLGAIFKIYKLNFFSEKERRNHYRSLRKRRNDDIFKLFVSLRRRNAILATNVCSKYVNSIAVKNKNYDVNEYRYKKFLQMSDNISNIWFNTKNSLPQLHTIKIVVTSRSLSS